MAYFDIHFFTTQTKNSHEYQYSTQPPTTANNTINAKGDLPSDAMNVSTPAQFSTTANNTINAEGDLPSDTLIPALPPFAARAVEAEDNLPAGSEDIIVGGYHIDGVANILGEESRQHVVALYEAAIPILKKKSESNQLMNKSKFDVIKEALLCICEGDESISELRIEFPSIYPARCKATRHCWTAGH